MESAFDSNVFLDEVKRHISDAIDEVKLSQQEALNEIRESTRPPLMICEENVTKAKPEAPQCCDCAAACLDSYCEDHRSARLADQQQTAERKEMDRQELAERKARAERQQQEGSSPMPEEAPRARSAENALTSVAPCKVPRNRMAGKPRDCDRELFPRRPSEEEITREGRCEYAADQWGKCLSFSAVGSEGECRSVRVRMCVSPPPPPPRLFFLIFFQIFYLLTRQHKRHLLICVCISVELLSRHLNQQFQEHTLLISITHTFNHTDRVH